MAFTFTDDGRTWQVWTDADGTVHDEPVTEPRTEPPMEASE